MFPEDPHAKTRKLVTAHVGELFRGVAFAGHATFFLYRLSLSVTQENKQSCASDFARQRSNGTSMARTVD